MDFIIIILIERRLADIIAFIKPHHNVSSSITDDIEAYIWSSPSLDQWRVCGILIELYFYLGAKHRHFWICDDNIVFLGSLH